MLRRVGAAAAAHHLKAAGGEITSQPEPLYVPNASELKAQLARGARLHSPPPAEVGVQEVRL